MCSYGDISTVVNDLRMCRQQLRHLYDIFTYCPKYYTTVVKKALRIIVPHFVDSNEVRDLINGVYIY
jgi:hypothetical protein